ncbi:LytR cell envelope-related transcriptional attenuator [Nocardioides aurantiacus]|uniref:LytR cell envelope-related transcriptional attenuator n=1 Tax=Nocardioides aurantiacus TaxID=86796 RepID=A0A3N2CY51_9ACTN|nr:LytR cell envelope-related transcriptional attenuator [Nocardioides aurantiacus]
MSPSPLRPLNPLSLRARDERGVVLSTRLLALSISAVAMAGLVFLANDPDEAGRPEQVTPAVTEPSPTPSASPTPSSTPTAKPTKKVQPVKPAETYVVVYNNTRTTGLAGTVAGRAKAAGWNVVGSDNWYGTVDGTTVYFPPRLKAAGKALGRDLGITSVKPAEEPMQFDRLTVILTDDYS